MYKFGNTTVIQTGDLVVVMQPTIMGEMATHTIQSPYTGAAIAMWLEHRHCLVQTAFPNMNDEDREFLISGITPAKWDAMFPKEQDQ